MTGKPVPIANADTKPFWDACNEKKLTYQSCLSCGHAQFYPRSLCANCGEQNLDWREAEPNGSVYTFTIVHRAPTPAFRAESPYVLALVDLADGFRMMMNIVNCPSESVVIGMPVQITFEDRDGQHVPQAEPAG